MSITKIKIGKVVPCEGVNSTIQYNLDFGSPHMIISKSDDGLDGPIFLNTQSIIANTDKIMFDSYHFEYLRIDQTIPFTITLNNHIGTYVSGGKKSSAYWQPVSGVDTFTIASHDRADVPAIFATGNGKVLSTAIYGYGTSLRTLTMYADASSVYLKDFYLAVETEIPSVVLSGTVYILKSSLSSGGGSYTPSVYGLYLTPTRSIFGQGKFDSDYNYLYVNPQGSKLTRQSAFKAQYGFRYAGAGGSDSSWNNSFSVLEDGVVVYNVNNIVVANSNMIDRLPSTVVGATMGVSVP